MAPPSGCDVLVAGSGNAGFAAAVAAKEAGAKHVLLIDKCPEEWAGGNSYFTAGAYRTVHGGTADLLPLVNNVDEETAKRIDLEPYTVDNFSNDMKRICSGRSDPRLAKILIGDSNATVKWLKSNGIRFQLSFNRQAYEVDGRLKFWGGLSLKTQDGGKGLIEDHKAAARKHGVEVLYSTPLKRLITDPKTGAVTAVAVQSNSEDAVIRTGAVILAAGGFESNPRLRSQYLGPGWDLAKVRGTPHNTGDCLETAIRDVSAGQAGNWSGCHSVAWDANAPSDTGDREASNEFTKSGYPLGLMFNILGERFVDEGIDLRNYTYAKFGRAILAQPSHVAFQIWDSRTISWLRSEEYRPERVERITADSIEELADKLTPLGLENRDAFVRNVKEYNEAVYAFQQENPDKKWDPAVRDGMSTQSRVKRLALGKTNWALPVDKAPFLAVAVTCGITFTFGGLKVNPETAQVVSSMTGKEVPGLYAVGEMMGGLFYENYPGGSGLTSGAVFGRRAGTAAAKAVAHS
ncbi:precorrin 3B synthase CobZ [Cladophialophora bantiana CBS 173.52]|uniref:Precorrin 3B synthase CobZ n=1 Tax=Cladophialophora bantiana (strain ATCC 10958 / CBS 173.52 / CDC B-1940 / NIH 8579) TaxID=1442370 RepID=A0A0D2GF62_CLAB1|nr:precorrin 3B synthase CobZ [Cladophialophora bantiana CBS 173.52]KIW96992.1 precorrin 3B synthase CobZ [Cladophialophora bantiana CBS 173.52]